MRTRDDILGAHMPESAATVCPVQQRPVEEERLQSGTLQGENVSA